jgi:formyltetrahydrofolate-dependent phosphoribosylglycinamide formyltransferase
MEGGQYKPATIEEVQKLREELHAKRKRLVFTSGCFDLLHAGHVRYLAQARAAGDALVVALNSDASVRALKGESRPIQSHEDRAEILSALRSVDAVVIFDENRTTKLIQKIKPHVFAKGGDYTVDSLNPEERAALDGVKAEIKILPLVPGRSTTKTVHKMLAPESSDGGKKLVLGILGSGKGTNFAAILRAIKLGELDAEVGVVFSDVAGSGMMKLAQEAGLPAVFVDPGPNPNKFGDAAQKEVCEHLERHQVDVVVLTGFMRLLKEPVLSAFQDRIVNVHPSLLPLFKGRDAPQQAINEGELESGCTVHLVNAEVDAGRILAQAKVPVLIGDTAQALHERIKEAEHRLLPQVLGEWRARGLPIRGGEAQKA